MRIKTLIIIITISVFFLGNSLNGQNIESNPIINAATYVTSYRYDLAGNRTKREVIFLNSSGLKSTQVNNTGEVLEDSPEVEKILEENLGNLNIKIFPNPTFGRLRVDLTGMDYNFPSSISIINISGDDVYNISPVLNSNEIDLSENTDGVYILVISANSKTTKWKVVKQ